MKDRYDLVIIGAGPGGYVPAIKAARGGLDVAVVERREVGGTCLNRGCVPTKALLHSAGIYSQLRSCERFGIDVSGASFDFGRINGYKDGVVSSLRSGIEQLMTSSGVDIIRGTAKVMGAGRVQVECSGQLSELSCKNILIAAGSEPAVLPIPGIDLPGVLNSDDILTGNIDFPDSITIVGGGVIGVEMACVFNSLGCPVTIVEAMDRILPNLDSEISQNLTIILKKRGVGVVTKAFVQSFSLKDGRVVVACKKGDEEMEFQAQYALVATGRRASTAGLFDEALEVAMQRGAIVVDERFMTSIDGVYAVGDAVFGSIQLAHAATAQGEAVVSMLLGQESDINLGIIPSCVFTSPEIASVGMCAADAKAKGIEVKTGKFPMSANAKSQLATQDRGFIKIVADASSDVVLGAQLMCEHATDLIGELALAVANGLTVSQILRTVHPHPTLCEAVAEAAADVNGECAHIARRRK